MAPAACRKPAPRSAGPAAESMNKKLKPADFPAEKTEAPKDLEEGEGIPPEYQDAIQKTLEQAKKPKKKP